MMLALSRSPVAINATQRAYTLLELLTVLLIIGVLMSIAVPSYRDVTVAQRLTAAASDIAAALQLARAEAIKRQTRVAVCEQPTRVMCPTENTWRSGWIVVADNNYDRAWDVHDSIVRAFSQDYPALEIYASRRGPLVFYPDGRSPGSTTTVTVCHRESNGIRQVILNNAGRVRIERSTRDMGAECR